MTPLVRRRDALEALVALADNVRRLPFKWGETDCGALFLRALACLDEDGGRHLARITWSSYWGAHKALEALTPLDLVRELGGAEIDLLDATGGDLVLGWDPVGPRGGFPTCHVGVGTHLLSSSMETGVVLFARHLVINPDRIGTLAAWRFV